MLAIPIFALFGGITIWGFFHPRLGAVIFIAGAVALAAWLILANVSLRSRSVRGLDLESMSPAEREVLKKHALYFLYPYQAQLYSSTFSLLGVLCVVWFGVLLWHREWVLAVCFVPALTGVTRMAPYLHPGNFLRYHNARNDLPEFLQEKLALVEAVEEKILEARARV
jgi:hypothetical protein